MPPNWELGPPTSNVGVCAKVNVAEIPGAPRLQIAISGFTIGEAKVMVSTPVKLPFRRRSSPTVLGEVVDVPPMKELLGDHRFDDPFVIAESSSPEYDTPTPPTEPVADPPPFTPKVALVQSVHIVLASAGGASSPLAATRVIPTR